MCWFTHGEPYVPYETMVEKMTGSTSSCNNVYEVVDDNSNLYQNMVMDTMRMNQGYADQCSIVDEEPNADTTRFFFLYLLKDFDVPLWDGFINKSKLLPVAQVFTIKLDHRLSKANYERIVE